MGGEALTWEGGTNLEGVAPDPRGNICCSVIHTDGCSWFAFTSQRPPYRQTTVEYEECLMPISYRNYQAGVVSLHWRAFNSIVWSRL